MSQQTFEGGQDFIFEVFMYAQPAAWKLGLQRVRNRYQDVDTSNSRKDDHFIQLSFHRYVPYWEAKQIIFYCLEMIGDDFFDGWGANYAMDKELDHVFDDWVKAYYGEPRSTDSTPLPSSQEEYLSDLLDE